MDQTIWILASRLGSLSREEVGYFENNIKSAKASSGKKYLKERQFSNATIKKYRLGISLDSWDSLFKEIKGKFAFVS